MAEALSRPLIWVLKGVRAGDSAQAMELALQVGGRVEGKQLVFNTSHMLPNWFAGARVSHLTEEARSLLRPPWPDLVVATGKRTAPVSVWIKKQSGGRVRIVQLGRPRMALHYFDLVVTTPQYGLPSLPNVVLVPLPFARTKAVAAADLQAFQTAWRHLPKPWVVGVVGGHKFPQRLRDAEISGFAAELNEMAKARSGSVILLDSPRSPRGALEIATQIITTPLWVFHRATGPNPYQPALALGDTFLVTSDSVSMATEMLLTGKPTSIYRLPTSSLVPRWSAQAGVGAMLAAKGVLHPPRDVNGLMGDLMEPGKNLRLDDIRLAHQAVVQRINTLLAVSSGSGRGFS